MYKKILAIIFVILSFTCIFGCGKVENNDNTTNNDKVDNNEQIHTEIFDNALSMDKEFVLDDITFKVVRCDTSELFPSMIGMKGVRVYIQYTKDKVYPSSNLLITDVYKKTYQSSLPDGLDYLGQYRDHSKEGIPYASFDLPLEQKEFLLTFKGEKYNVSLKINVKNIDIGE